MTSAAVAWPSAGRDLEPLRATFPARVVVDPSAIAQNFRALDASIDAASIAVIKADAYGHGLFAVADALEGAGCSTFALAQGEEALRLAKHLRSCGSEARILTWITWPGEVSDLVERGIELGVSTPEQVHAGARAAHACGVNARLHLAIDTGMSRAGAMPEDFSALCATAAAAHGVDVVGVWSHLARADDLTSDGQEATRRQIERFEQACEQARAHGLTPSVRHLAASAGGLAHARAHADAVRWGISLYGYAPSAQLEAVRLIEAKRLEALLISLKRVPAGSEVSYGGTWVAPGERWLGIVPVGYANGIPRTASGRAEVAIAGRRYRQVGRICMDQMIIDLGPASEPAPAAVGDLVEVLGGRGPDAREWAGWAETIPYEILTSFGQRVPYRLANSSKGDDSDR
ncbi:MAG: alanine racemase [Actinomycetaceae bacterium]|nr:alanine racemase [Actinomycetaceae bacterium]